MQAHVEVVAADADPGGHRQGLNALGVLERAGDDLTRWLDRFEG